MRRRGKYNASPITIDNIRFASRAEGRRYGELKLLLQAGEIRDLELQRRYPLWGATPDGKAVTKVCDYVCDFQYWRGEEFVVEDTKGGPTVTPLFRLKKKLMLACHGIDVQVVYMGREKK